MKNTTRNRFILIATAVYVVFALVWIFLSDRLLNLITDIDAIVWVSTSKGIFFVLMTGLLFFFAMRAVPPPDAVHHTSLLDTLTGAGMPRRQSRCFSYLFAFVITLSVVLVRQHLVDPASNRPLLVLFMLPITLSALLGGLGPGLLATVLAAAAVNFQGILPLRSFQNTSSLDVFQWVLLVVNGLLVTLLTDGLRRSLEKSRLDRKLLDTIVSGTPDAIFIKNTEGRYLLANEATSTFVGRPVEAILGQRDQDFLPAESAAEIRANDLDILAKRQILTREERLTNHDGEQQIFLATKGPIFDQDGQITGLFGIARNITERKRNEEKILESKANLDAALASMSDAICISDAQGHLLHVNEAFASFHRFKSKQECSDRVSDYPNLLEVYTPDGRRLPLEQWPISRALRGETAIDDEVSLKRSDTGECWDANFNFAPIRSAAGEVIGAVMTGRDITERRRTASELRQYRERLEQMVEARTGDLQKTNRALRDTEFAMESVGIGIAWVNADDGSYLYTNKLAGEMLGYSPEEMRALTVSDIDPTFAVATFAETSARFRALGQSEFESVNRAKDGREIPVEVALHYLPAAAGDAARFILFIKDISTRKKTEAELTCAMEAAGEANRLKSAFIANMSHEIRTPMNAILGLAYLLQRQSLPGDADEMVGKIRLAGRSLLGIINDILDFSKIEAGKLEIEVAPFRLDDVLDNLSTIMSTSAAGKDLELIITPPPRATSLLNGDALRIEQVLINLTSNAIKFTDHGHVSLSVTVAGESEHKLSLRFSICDTGIGIPFQQQQEIFAPFSQGDSSTSRRFGGTGLGLAISRKLVTAMGGELRVASVPGSGSEFWFVLDFERAPDAWLAAPKMAGLEVMVADDNPIVRNALQNIIQGLGWSSTAVASGEAAVRHMQQREQRGRDKEVLLLDFDMPGMDGLATARAIRHGLKNADDPIIIMVTTGNGPPLQEQPDARLADSVLTKPVTASSLYNAVARALRVRQGGQEEMPVRHEQRLAGLRLLVVDDSDFNRDVARQIFASDGATVVLANDGQQAYDFLRLHPDSIDVVLMDVQMPVMNGYDSTRLIRRTPALADLPVIALTAGAFNEQQDLANEAGMTGFIAKPFDVDSAIALILKLSGRAARSVARTVTSVAAPVAASPAAHPSLPGMAIARALDVWQDAAVYRQYLAKFARDYADSARQMAAMERAPAAALAHKLKGAAGSLALEQVSAMAGQVDSLYHTGADPAAGLRTLQEALDTALTSIAQYLAAADGPADQAAPAANPAQLDALLNQLLAAFDSDNPDRVRPLLSELGKLLPAPRLAALRQALEDFDFRGGETAARTLAGELGITLAG